MQDLGQIEVLMGQGRPRIDAIRQISVTEQTIFRLKMTYARMGTELQQHKRRMKDFGGPYWI